LCFSLLKKRLISNQKWGLLKALTFKSFRSTSSSCILSEARCFWKRQHHSKVSEPIKFLCSSNTNVASKNELTNEWTNKRINGRTIKRMNKVKNEQTDERTNEWSNEGIKERNEQKSVGGLTTTAATATATSKHEKLIGPVDDQIGFCSAWQARAYPTDS